MTSWTKWRIQSLRSHRVASLGEEGAVFPIPAQWRDPGTYSIPGCPLHQQLQCGFCIADGIYQPSGSEFRVASSVEQLNIIEVGTY